MSTDTADKQPRGRVIEERARRRRRDDLGMSRHRQLAVDTSKFDPQYTYRIINDDPGRIHALTVQDDWDIVTRSELGDQRDAKEKGLDYYQADKAKEQAAINDRMKDIRRGKHEGSDALAGPNAYVPEGGISIREGGRG
jgi:hypothetical protein